MIRKIMMVVSVIGLLDATYLLIIKLTANKALCIPGLGDCWSVNTSVYSEWNGIPNSAFGIAAYLSILLILIFRSRFEILKTFGHIAVFGIGLVGFIFSIYLTYLQFAVIKAICPFCIISAITMSTLFVLSVFYLLQNQKLNDTYSTEK